MSKARAASRRRSNIVVRYLRETSAELRKVSWPSREEATRLTILVLVVLALMSTLLGVLDAVFSQLIAWILGLG